MTIILKIKKIHEDARINYDDGLELYSCQDKIIPVNGRKLISTGICIELPPSTVIHLRPVCDLVVKHGIVCINMHSHDNYSGEIKVILENRGDSPFQVFVGQKIASLIITPVINPLIQVVEELEI